MGDRYKEHTLWRLRELNDWDKHNFVVRTFLAVPHGIEIEWTNDAGRSQTSSSYGSEEIQLGGKFYFGPAMGIRPETKVDIKTKPFIVFEDIRVSKDVTDTVGLPFEPISKTLNELADEVTRIVDSFSGEFSV